MTMRGVAGASLSNKACSAAKDLSLPLDGDIATSTLLDFGDNGNSLICNWDIRGNWGLVNGVTATWSSPESDMIVALSFSDSSWPGILSWPGVDVTIGGDCEKLSFLTCLLVGVANISDFSKSGLLILLPLNGLKSGTKGGRASGLDGVARMTRSELFSGSSLWFSCQSRTGDGRFEDIIDKEEEALEVQGEISRAFTSFVRSSSSWCLVFVRFSRLGGVNGSFFARSVCDLFGESECPSSGFFL